MHSCRDGLHVRRLPLALPRRLPPLPLHRRLTPGPALPIEATENEGDPNWLADQLCDLEGGRGGHGSVAHAACLCTWGHVCVTLSGDRLR